MSVTRTMMVIFNQQNGPSICVGRLWLTASSRRTAISVPSGWWKAFWPPLMVVWLAAPHHLPGVPSLCPPIPHLLSFLQPLTPSIPWSEKCCLGVGSHKSNTVVIWEKGEDLLLQVEQGKGNLSPWCVWEEKASVPGTWGESCSRSRQSD